VSAAPDVGTTRATADVSLSELPLRAELRGAQPYGAPQHDVPVRLNTNENPYPPSATIAREIGEAAARAARSLNRYPDREAYRLREDLARYLGYGLHASEIWAANGSNEVMLHMLQAFAGPGRTVLSFAPTYSMYPEYARDTHSAWVVGRRRDDFSLDPEHAGGLIEKLQPAAVLLASPNNPTGTALPIDLVEHVCAVAPGMVVVDEAYAEFARPGTPSALTLLEGRPRLVVSRTMSKAFAFAGGRLGYLAADPALVDALRLVRLPYHLSAPTQAIAVAALRHVSALLGTVDVIKGQRDRIVGRLAELGLEPVPSDANFVLFGGLADAAATWRELLDRGVLVRDVGIPHYLRVTAGTPAETDAFLDAMAEVAPRAMDRSVR
jgi:histidinol-phosphate aminotransferase